MQLNELPLDVLIRNAGNGDSSSFSVLYQRTSAHLFGVAVRLLRDRQLAEDVLQEAYVSVWKHSVNYSNVMDGRSISSMSWLIAIVRNKSLDVLRSQVRRKEVELPDVDEESGEHMRAADASAPSALAMLEDAALSLHITQCIDFMEAAPRQCIALAYYHGLSHSEIALQIGAPVGSVKSWVRRGLMKLKTCLITAGAAH